MAANDALIAEATEVQAELQANTLGERLAVIDKLTDALKLADAACEKAEHERLFGGVASIPCANARGLRRPRLPERTTAHSYR